jgi:hypothetical protein
MEAAVTSSKYADLNDLLCEAMFSKDKSSRPAYVELDEQVEVDLISFFDCNLEEVRSHISKLVAERISQTGTKHDPFIGIHRNLLAWRKSLSQTPSNYPEIPLLLTFTFAAVDMGGDGGHDPNAYYPRLHEMLKISEQGALAESYRNFSSYLWGSLNYWLDVVHNGRFGIGTAYSIGTQKHVGFPLSQALIRSTDRKKLPRLFRRNGFSAFASIIENDIEPIIDEWVSADEHAFGSYKAPSKPFIRLWAQSEARDKICTLICRELESWDGTVPKILREDGALVDDDELLVRLEATRTSFPTNKLNVSFAVSGFTLNEKRHIDVVDAENEKHSIALAVDPAGWMRPNVGVLPISDQDLLEKGLNVEYDGVLKASRSPKKVVVLRLDDLTHRYREVERIELGIRSMVIVQDFKETLNSVREIISTCSRPTPKEINSSELPGLPVGWVLFADVELFQPPAPDLVKHANLEALKPVQSGSLTFSSGLQLPGRTPKWHGAIGLEIRATVVGSTKLTVRIERYEDGEVTAPKDTEYFQQTIIHKIEEDELEDGDYKVHILVGEDLELFASRNLHIRSADTPDQETWNNAQRLVYDIGKSPSAVLTASPLESIEYLHIDGAVAAFYDDAQLNLTTRIPQNSEWWGTKTAIFESKVKSFALADTSNYPCFEKGNHYLEYPTAERNKSGTGFLKNDSGKIDGVCKYCGLVRRSPANPWVAARLHQKNLEKKEKTKVELSLPKVAIHELPKVDSLVITPDHALDALMHLGGGSDGYISSIASNVDPSALFRHEFVKSLEQMAHIDVSRDSLFQIESWEINPSIIVKTADDYFLSGYWPTSYWSLLVEKFGEDQVTDIPEQGTASRMSLKSIEVDSLEKALEELDIPAEVVESPSVDMLRILPDIKLTALGLTPMNSSVFDEVCVYSSEQNSWVPISESRPTKVGGYRISSAYRNQYVVMTSEDLETKRIRYCSAEFAKFFATATAMKKPLFSFREEQQMLLVPRGSSLPGMYGRAAVMASGYLPKLDQSGRYLVYTQIKNDFAELLAARLGGQ